MTLRWLRYGTIYSSIFTHDANKTHLFRFIFQCNNHYHAIHLQRNMGLLGICDGNLKYLLFFKQKLYFHRLWIAANTLLGQPAFLVLSQITYPMFVTINYCLHLLQEIPRCIYMQSFGNIGASRITTENASFFPLWWSLWQRLRALIRIFILTILKFNHG